MKRNPLGSPFLKWAGGKRQLLPDIRTEAPRDYATYFEPFVGGGAVLFSLQPRQAVVGDVNQELINVYTVIRDNVDELICDLKKHKNEIDYYYWMREKDRDRDQYKKLGPIARASRLIYLNKTCYNGLFRVNRQGEFNVPFGRYKKPNIVNESVLRAVSDYFNNSQIVFESGDFCATVRGAQEGDFVYLDPPYDPVSSSANFTGYNTSGFSQSDQIRLKELCDDLHKKKVKFLLSNSATDFILDLYKDYNLKIVQAKRSINSKADRRGAVPEVLVNNYGKGK